MVDFLLPGASVHGTILASDLALISDAAGNINRVPYPTERTYHLTVPESTKNADHAALGLVDWILPKPTNTSADAAALQAAISAAPNGARFLEPQGTYLHNAIVSYPAGCEVHGAGAAITYGTVHKMANGANLDTVICDAGWLSLSTTPSAGVTTKYFDFAIDGNRTNQTSGLGHGLVTFTQGALIQRVDPRNTIGDGICPSSGTRAGFAMTSSCNEVKIIDCKPFNCGGAGIHIDEFNTTARLTDGFIVDCIVDGNSNGDYGILIDGNAGWLVEGNHVYAVKKSSIRSDRNFACRIVHNYCEGYGIHATAGSYYGIDCDTSGMLDHASVFVTGNEVVAPISSPAAATILFGIGVLASSSVTSAYLNVSGNIVRGRTAASFSGSNSTTGILIHNASGSSVLNAVESGNIIGSNASEAWDIPITIGSALTINLASYGNTGQDRLTATAFSATPTLLPARVEANTGWLMTLTANITGMTMTAGRDGQIARLFTKQDGTGSRTVVWPTNSTGLAAPAAGANVVTCQSVQWVSALSLWVKIS